MAPDDLVVKAAALVFAAVPVLASASMALFLWIALAGPLPFENTEPWEPGVPARVTLICALGAALPLSLMLVHAVARGRLRSARIAVSLHAASALLVLIVALGESSRSVGDLAAFLVGAEFCGLGAVFLAAQHVRQPRASAPRT